jgi:hypothetical protein
MAVKAKVTEAEAVEGVKRYRIDTMLGVSSDKLGKASFVAAGSILNATDFDEDELAELVACKAVVELQ